MLAVKINGKRYRVPTRWEEITLAQCVWLSRKVQEQPAEIIDYYRSFASPDEPKPIDNADAMMHFVAEIVGGLAHIPTELLLQVAREDVMPLALAVTPRFVLGALGITDYQSQRITSFRLRRHRYMMPEVGTDIAGERTPLSEITAIELCMASDIVLANKLKLAPLAVAILCRRAGEPYSDKLAQKRAEEFKTLPASIYWEVWTHIEQAHAYLRQSFPACYGGGGKEVSEDVPTSWVDTLVSMAADKPSELDKLQRMNGYDFVHLLSANIKKQREEWKMRSALAAFGAM